MLSHDYVSLMSSDKCQWTCVWLGDLGSELLSCLDDVQVMTSGRYYMRCRPAEDPPPPSHLRVSVKEGMTFT